MKRTTIKDLAARLSLSVSTVSRALSGDRNISDGTRERVLAAAKEMGYTPNPAAKSMRGGRSGAIGVLVPEMETRYTIQVIKGIQHVFYPKGIRVIIADAAEDPAMERENLLLMERFMVDGIIFCQCSYQHNADLLGELQERGLQMVSFGRIPYGLEVSQVLVDDYAKSFFVVEKMIQSGCRHICHFRGPDNIYNSTERARGFRDVMEKYGLPYEERLGGLSMEDGYVAVDRLVAEGLEVDGVFAFNEAVGVGAMNHLRELGFRIPEDISVAAFSGTDLSKAVFPQLTSVEPPMFEMGCTAARMLIERVLDPATPVRTVILNAEINLRGSTGKK